MLSELRTMSRTARAVTAFVAVLSGAVVSAALEDAPLWLQMIASLLTALIVGSVIVVLLGRRRDR